VSEEVADGPAEPDFLAAERGDDDVVVPGRHVREHPRHLQYHGNPRSVVERAGRPVPGHVQDEPQHERRRDEGDTEPGVAAQVIVAGGGQNAHDHERDAEHDRDGEAQYEERGAEYDRHQLALGVVMRRQQDLATGLGPRDAPDEVAGVLAPFRGELLEGARPLEAEVDHREERHSGDDDQRRPPEVGEGPHDAYRADDEAHGGQR